MFGKGGMGNLMKKAQEMQDKMKDLQEEISKIEVVGESGGGLVKVTTNGKHQVLKVQIDPSLLQDDQDMLEDLIAAACNDSTRKIQETHQDKMSNITGGLDLPPDFKMPF